MRKHNLGECEGESMFYHVRKDLLPDIAGSWKRQLVSRMLHCELWENSILYWMNTYRHMATNAHPIITIHKDLYHLNFLIWNKLQLIGYLVLGRWPVIAKLSLPTANHSKFNSLCKTLRPSTWHEHRSAKLSHLLPYNRACWQASSSYINSTCVGVKTDSSMESFSMF